MMDFKDQRVIITGGTRGIGRGIAQAFLKAGATVIATYAGNDKAAEEFKTELGDLGDKLDTYKFDVTDTKAVEEFYKTVEDKYPSIEVLVNNSGIRKDSMMAMMSDEDWQRVMDVNLGGTFYMSRGIIRHLMGNKYGRIINMSSIGGSLGLAGQANYAASKAGQVAITKTLSKEVGKKGITVNSICPGFIDTELIDDLPEDQVKEYKKSVPLRRFGKVEEVAHAVMFLASKEASYITGTTLDVAGGL
jgi:3-oxoacyl-[acyl-carrier protein] reductase